MYGVFCVEFMKETLALALAFHQVLCNTILGLSSLLMALI